MLAVGALLVVAAVWWNVGRYPDIADAMSRVNCQQLYQAAPTRAESLAVDGQAEVHRRPSPLMQPKTAKVEQPTTVGGVSL
jgi:hypothetical protein